MTRKLLKILHELGGIGVIGALACCLVLVATAPTDSLAGYAAVREGIHAITRWVLLPSLLAALAPEALASALPDAEAVAPLLRTEWRGLWTMLALSLLNLLLAVWRPRLRRRSRSGSAAAGQ